MSFSQQTLLHLNQAREHGLLFASHDAVPAIMTGEGAGAKMYQVRGNAFNVPSHYEVLSVVGYGAYGIVCAAVDLRLVPGTAYTNDSILRNEEEGRILLRKRDNEGNAQLFGCRHFLNHSDGPDPSSGDGRGQASSSTDAACSGSIRAPTLLAEPYFRRVLPNGRRSPYVAIKKVPKVFDDLIDGRRVLREIKMLRYLRGHPNIVRLEQVMYPPGEAKADFSDIYMTTDLMDTDLSALLKSTLPVHEEQFRFIAYQIIKALIYVHSSGVIHRDIKPGNILLNSDCEMKLCDFGLARGGVPLFQASTGPDKSGFPGTSEEEDDEDAALFAKYQFSAFDSSPSLLDYYGSGDAIAPEPAASSSLPVMYSLTGYVVTRYYRAPELLVMSRYNHAVDMWSLGCVLAEMLTRTPVFRGVNYLSQLTLIMETPGLRGLPRSEDEVDEIFAGGMEGKQFIKDILLGCSTKSPTPAAQADAVSSAAQESRFRAALFGSKSIPKGASTFISKLLNFDPRKRPTALEALRDPFFAPIYTPSDEIVHDGSMPPEEYLTPAATLPDAATYTVEDEPHPYMWEFDHRVADVESLHELFCEEIDIYYAKTDGHV